MFAETTWQGRRFNKLVVFDEAHKYIDSPDLVAGLVEVVREMRHKGTVMVASQDPPSVPTTGMAGLPRRMQAKPRGRPASARCRKVPRGMLR